MRSLLPSLLLCLAILFLAASPSLSQDPGPINVFRPEAGQRTTLYATAPDGRIFDTLDYRITRKAGDTAFFERVGKQGPEMSLVWSQGRLRAQGLLSNVLDTNGIYLTYKPFPIDFSASPKGSHGYTVRHEVQGYQFDTLLVSCYYRAATDEGDVCDFFTPSGHLVYTHVKRCLCFYPEIRALPGPGILAALGGRRVETAALRPSRPLSTPHFGYPAGFDLRGRRTDGGPRGSFLVPAK